MHDTTWTYYYLLTMESTMNAFTTYPKVSPTSMPVDEVEEWLNTFPHKRAENKPNGGIIQSTPSVIFVDGLGDKLTPSERKIAERKAQQDFKAAIRQIAKQEAEDRKAIANKKREWTREAELLAAKERRERLLKRLNSGKLITIPSKKRSVTKYRAMRADIEDLKPRLKGLVVRLADLKTEKSWWCIDTMESYDGDIDYDCIISVKSALNTGKMIRISDGMHQSDKQVLARTTNKLDGVARVYGLDKRIKGWVAL